VLDTFSWMTSCTVGIRKSLRILSLITYRATSTIASLSNEIEWILCGFENIFNLLLTYLILKVGKVIPGNDSTTDYLLSGALNERDFTKLADEEPEDRQYSVVSSNL
jgi:hypothetical protein